MVAFSRASEPARPRSQHYEALHTSAV